MTLRINNATFEKNPIYGSSWSVIRYFHFGISVLLKTNLHLEQREMNVLKGGVCANCACVNYGYPTGGGGNSSTGTVANY